MHKYFPLTCYICPYSTSSDFKLWCYVFFFKLFPEMTAAKLVRRMVRLPTIKEHYVYSYYERISREVKNSNRGVSNSCVNSINTFWNQAHTHHFKSLQYFFNIKILEVLPFTYVWSYLFKKTTMTIGRETLKFIMSWSKNLHGIEMNTMIVKH